MQCNGKCYLKKQIKKQEEKDHKQLPTTQKEVNEIVYEMNPFEVLSLTQGQFPEHIALPTFFQPPHTASWIEGVFHPPQISQKFPFC